MTRRIAFRVTSAQHAEVYSGAATHASGGDREQPRSPAVGHAALALLLAAGRRRDGA